MLTSGDAPHGMVIGGLPTAALLRTCIPLPLTRALLTRGVLNSNPAIVLHTLRLLDGLLKRCAAAMREVCAAKRVDGEGAAAAAAVGEEEEEEEEEAGDGVEALEEEGPSSADLPDDFPAAVQALRAHRARAFSTALLAALPDITSIVSVRAKVTALSATPAESWQALDVEFWGAEGGGGVRVPPAPQAPPLSALHPPPPSCAWR